MDDDNSKNVWPRRLAVGFAWMVLGAVLVLVSLPYFPSAWTNWIGDRQDNITESVSWGDSPQGRVVSASSVSGDASDEPGFGNPVPPQDALAAPSGPNVSGVILRSPDGSITHRDLVRLRKWQGSGDSLFSIDPAEGPWILLWEFQGASAHENRFRVTASGDYGELTWTPGQVFTSGFNIFTDSRNHLAIQDDGRTRIEITASGIDWTVFALAGQ